MNVDSEIADMTVNERLYHLGLFKAFDDAVLSGEITKVVAVLEAAPFDDAQAYETASTVLANPAEYGYPPHAGA